MPYTDFHEEEITEKPFDARLMVRLLGYLKPYIGWVALAFALILLTSIISQAGPYLTKIAVDTYILKGNFQGLNRIVLLFVGLLLLQFLTSYGERFITQLTGQWAMYDVRAEIFAHLQRLPLAFFDRTPIGRLMTRNTNDVDALNELFTDGIVASFSDLFTVIAIIVYMFYLDTDLALVTCAAVPVMFGVTFWFQSRMLRAFRLARTRLARLNAFLQENITGMDVVQLFNRERRHTEQFDAVNSRYVEANLLSALYNSFFYPIMELIGAVVMALAIWYGSGEVVRSRIDWGILIAMLQYIPRFFWPILDIAERYAILQTAMASSERIFELLDTKPEPEGGNVAPQRATGEIEFRNVWFAYKGEEWVLRDVSFHITPGESVALVGATGSGKTTTISLLARFYDIQKGAILVDGIDIREWNVEGLRRRIGIVQQDVFLFSGNIEENIRLGNQGISQERVEQAAQDVNADRFIQRLPDGYQHTLTERGSTLSSGQRQLLAFARALAFDPDILVLDEATASVDTETELWIQDAVERLMQTRTSIIIAHRLSTIRNADTIIVMHKGEVREIGRHEELLAKDGIYRRLHQLQYSDREKETTVPTVR
ncbi:MAG: ABC transporter ATP-binding protein [Candidatus Latescibacteria bacterium]|nr:ABC transporter ATP-binding protein [Candidatus Latescibacterota bacterium]